MKVLVLALTLVLGASIAPAHAASILLTAAGGAPTAGETFTLDVTVTGVLDGRDPLDEVIAFGFLATIDDPILAFVSATVAAPFDDVSSLFGLDAAGTVFPGMQADPLFLATLTFQALSAGTTRIGIASDMLDPSQGLFYAFGMQLDVTADTAITIEAGPTGIPEPATLLLVGAGGGLALLRRRKRGCSADVCPASTSRR